MYEEIDSVRIGENIKDHREAHGMSETEMAKRLGISQSAIAMYEGGRRIPRDEIKIRIAMLFGVPVETIFYQKKSHEV